jgi:phenylacetate-coenzyme A ligase PaaK-like adenylate-forming protein
MRLTSFHEQLLDLKPSEFDALALDVFRYQYNNLPLYKQFADALQKTPERVTTIEQIPFLPIHFFKTHPITSSPASLHFESSGTTGQVNSKHYVADADLYHRTSKASFEHFFGPLTDYCILALLPSYLERGNSSLVYMVQTFMTDSGHSGNGFFLHDFSTLQQTLLQLESKKQKTLLIGVTYALLDFADACPMPLQHTLIMETGGMKGRRAELTREEVHHQLQQAFSVDRVYSEYGMTELLSQAYSTGNGLFQTPAWMKILMRNSHDPFEISRFGKGVMNIIDLANVHSCSFIATDDIGDATENGFYVFGRLDHADIRGCNLLLM